MREVVDRIPLAEARFLRLSPLFVESRESRDWPSLSRYSVPEPSGETNSEITSILLDEHDRTRDSEPPCTRELNGTGKEFLPKSERYDIIIENYRSEGEHDDSHVIDRFWR